MPRASSHPRCSRCSSSPVTRPSRTTRAPRSSTTRTSTSSSSGRSRSCNQADVAGRRGDGLGGGPTEMKITRIDTLRLEEFPNLLFVTVHTDDGLVGLGETFFGARAVEAYLHESVA